MKISASIYSNKEKAPAQWVRELDAHGIDMFHIDCFDDSVFEDIKKIRETSKTPVDLHIIHKEPARFFDQIAKYKIDFVSIQYGADVVIPSLPEYTGTQWGLALVADDPLSVYASAEHDFDFILFMASAPGVSGKPFNRETFQRIIEFKQQFPKKKIQVDGGVNDRIAFILRLLGIDSIVSGNYLLNREFLGAGMLNLHKTPGLDTSGNDFQLSDFMTPAKYLPVLQKEHLSLRSALETVEKFGLGFLLVTNNDGKLEGVISNADLRRGFIRYLDNADDKSANGMINTRPVSIRENNSLADMLHLLNNLNFIILFLPVVDTDNKLKGAVLLNNLTRV